MAEGELQVTGQRRRRRLKQSLSADPCIFEMEMGLEELNKTFTDPEEEDDEDNEEDDENKETDGDLCGSERSTNGQYGSLCKNETDSKCVRQFATSLPIQVPLWKTSSHVLETDDDDYHNITYDEDPSKIAESFRALAWSVKDGTEMFGDLPRHRLNTGDLVKSRPI